MRHYSIYLFLLLGVVSLFTSCKKEKKEYTYSICLIVDGTDAQVNQNAVPHISLSEIEKLMDSLSILGYGSLYLTYVDENSANNAVAEWSWYQKPPKDVELKTGDGSSELQKKTKEHYTNQKEYWKAQEEARAAFSLKVDSVLSLAYAKEGTRKSKGSDVYGAVNKALSYVVADEGANISLILLVSDLEHNTKNRELLQIPKRTKLFAVGTSLDSNSDLKPIKEFATFDQVIRYIPSQDFLNTCLEKQK